ncbi:MAG: cell division protein FtsZ, partial [Patescibacteria group bacterium]
MGIGIASGDNRAINAARAAVESPLLEVSIDGARGVLFVITAGPSLSMHEVNEAAEVITASSDPDAKIIFGTVIDEKMGDELKVTVIATGFRSFQDKKAPEPSVVQAKEPVYSPEAVQHQDEPRRERRVFVKQKESVEEPPVEVEDELDIPTFIRNRMRKK